MIGSGTSAISEIRSAQFSTRTSFSGTGSIIGSKELMTTVLKGAALRVSAFQEIWNFWGLTPLVVMGRDHI
jgi:hypothetical protein